MDKFDWQARESAPQHYVMRIIGGTLSYHDSSGSLYVPDKSDIDLGWGTGISSHIVGPDLKPLPNHLTIIFFSYIENQFYDGRFDLPYAKILKMFQDGYYSPRKEKRAVMPLMTQSWSGSPRAARWRCGWKETAKPPRYFLVRHKRWRRTGAA